MFPSIGHSSLRMFFEIDKKVLFLFLLILFVININFNLVYISKYVFCSKLYSFVIKT